MDHVLRSVVSCDGVISGKKVFGVRNVKLALNWKRSCIGFLDLLELLNNGNVKFEQVVLHIYGCKNGRFRVSMLGKFDMM